MSKKKEILSNKVTSDAKMESKTASKNKKPTPKEDFEKMQEQYTRLQAEYANFVRRTQEERSQLYDNATRDVLGSIVKVLDDFQLALQNANNLESFKKGMEMIYANIVSAGEEFGLEKIKTIGEEFDPTKHEALLAEKSKKKEQTILAELQSGYAVKGKIIRTAKVKVAK